MVEPELESINELWKDSHYGDHQMVVPANLLPINCDPSQHRTKSNSKLSKVTLLDSFILVQEPQTSINY